MPSTTKRKLSCFENLRALPGTEGSFYEACLFNLSSRGSPGWQTCRGFKQRQERRYKAYYSLDCDDGIEYSAVQHAPTPQELLDRKEMFFLLWNALNSLPEIQGRRVDAHFILGKTYRMIAAEEGVDKSNVRQSVLCGLATMRKFLQKNF